MAKLEKIKNGEIFNDEPISYVLLPLANLKNEIPELQLDRRFSVELPEPTAQLILDVFKNVELKIMSFHLFYAQYKPFESYMPENLKIQMREKLESTQSDLTSIKNRFRHILLKHRSGTGENDEESLAEFIEESNKMQEKIDSFMKLEDWKGLDEKIHEIERLKSFGIVYDTKKNGYEKILKKINCIVFFCAWSKRHIGSDYAKCVGELEKIAKSTNIPTYFIDQEIYGGSFVDKNQLCYFKNGIRVSENLCREISIERYLNVAIPMKKSFSQTRIPTNAVVLNLRCPSDNCGNVKKFWLCPQCRMTIWYGLDMHFYCKCGKNSAYNYKFRCG